MHIIELKKFGNILLSRPAGLEAFSAIRPQLDPDMVISIDFAGVLTVAPTWLDEFLTQLTTFNAGKVELLPTKNASVLAALPVLAEARKDFVAATVSRALENMKANY